MKTGLVLEGGGVRGIYTAGVLDVFLEKGIFFDSVIGVSAGAIHGCSYLSGQRGRSIRYYKKYITHPRFLSLKSWIRTGDIAEAEFCYHELPEKLDPYDYEAFSRCGIPFYAACTNIKTGQAEYLQVTDMLGEIDIIRASASLPYFSRLVPIRGENYLDGGCADAIPLKAFENMGYGRNVVILTRPANYVKKPELPALAPIVYGRYPAFVQTLKHRHDLYNKAAAYVRHQEAAGAAFVIRPQEPLNIGRLEADPDKVQQVYDAGRTDALKALPDLMAWRKENSHEN